MSLAEIKEAIEQLSFEQRAELAAWLHGWEDDEWDEQIKGDIAAGRFDAVIREIDEDTRAGAHIRKGKIRNRGVRMGSHLNI